MSKVWLITGASRGLGRAFTEEALKAGHRVVATARNSEHLVDVASKFGKSVRTVPLDVTNEANPIGGGRNTLLFASSIAYGPQAIGEVGVALRNVVP